MKTNEILFKLSGMQSHKIEEQRSVGYQVFDLSLYYWVQGCLELQFSKNLHFKLLFERSSIWKRQEFQSIFWSLGRKVFFTKHLSICSSNLRTRWKFPSTTQCSRFLDQFWEESIIKCLLSRISSWLSRIKFHGSFCNILVNTEQYINFLKHYYIWTKRINISFLICESF